MRTWSNPDTVLRLLKKGQFKELLGDDYWRQFAPTFYQEIADAGMFTILVSMRCGCKMPIFYRTVKAEMVDGTVREALVSQLVTPKDWDAQCPNAMLPESAVDKPVFEMPVPWSHTTITLAVERVEAVAAAERVIGAAT